MNDREQFFLQQSVAFAMSLPHRDCVRFLQGLLFFGGEHEAAHDLRALIQSLTDTHAQLELIATGQLVFDLAA